MQYTCAIADALLQCTIISDRDLTTPVFCFSGMAPMAPVAGGRLIRALGSYTEVALPDLVAGEAHHVTIKYGAGYHPANRAWMPLGPYLRHGDEVIVLPPTEAGRRGAVRPVGVVKGLPVLPEPALWVPDEGTLRTTGFVCDDPTFRAVADLASRQGMVFAGPTAVTFVHDDMADAAYHITVTAQGVTIKAGSDSGRFYAGVTLLHMLVQGAVPCGVIEDAPRFAWRGQHLDCARHAYAPDTILALLDLMAMLKMNRFHWHFADDEAFRLELNCLPELWQKTAMRGEGHMLPGLFAAAPEQGGTYSRAVAEQIVAHAKALHIEVLPEIEAPAHALAITTLYTDTRDPGDTGVERSVQGYAGNVMNPAMPRTWEILKAMVREVGDIFPFGYIHLGGDELPQETWMGSPKARALMQQEGLSTTQDLQGWMMARLAAFARDCGLRPAAWEEAALGCQGGIGHDAVLFSWTGQGAGLDAARAGYDVVMTPAQHVYLDMAHTSDVDDWGACWAAFVDLPDTVNWDPVPDVALAAQIKGVQGAFWSEFTVEDAQMWPMLMPRILGVAAMCWQSTPPTPDRIATLSGLYDLSPKGRLRPVIPNRPD